VPLDELEEHRRAVADRLGEDLQQVAVLVPVHEDAARPQLFDRDPDPADALPQHRVGVVGVGRREELHAPLPQRVNGGEDVRRRQRQVLHARAAVVLEVLVDLRLLLADGRLVQRELHAVVAVGDHLAHQRRVLGGDVVADELGQVGEPHDPVVEVHPVVHLAELHIADHMVERDERRCLRGNATGPRDVTREVNALVPGAVDQRVPGVPVRGDRPDPDSPVLIAHIVRLLEDPRPGRPRVRDALVDVGHLKRHVDHTVAVHAVVVGDRAVRRHGALDHEPHRPGAEHVGVVVAVPRLRAGVRLERHPERQLEVQRRLRRVPGRPDDGVPAGHRERVAAEVVRDDTRQHVGASQVGGDCHRCLRGVEDQRSSLIRTDRGIARQPPASLVVR